MAGKYDDILKYWNKMFSGDDLAEELSREKYKLESGSYQSEVLGKIEDDMYATWQKRYSDIPYDEYRRNNMAGYLEVVDKFVSEGVPNMSLMEHGKSIDLQKYSNISKNIQPAFDNEAMFERGYEWLPTLGRWGKKDLRTGGVMDIPFEPELLKDKKELNQEFKEWSEEIRKSDNIDALTGLMDSLVDLKSKPEYVKSYKERVDEEGKKDFTFDKIKSRQTDEQIMSLIERANDKIKSQDKRLGFSERTIDRLKRVKKDLVEPLNYKEASKSYGKGALNDRVETFKKNYPTVDLYEARKEVINRLQTEDRIKNIGTKPATPLDLAWVKWMTDYSGLRRNRESPEQDLRGLKEMKYFASYTGYYPVYKQAGLNREDAKVAQKELKSKIDYLEGLEKQAKQEIRKSKDRTPKPEPVKEEVVNPEPVIEDKAMSESEQSKTASRAWLDKQKEKEE